MVRLPYSNENISAFRFPSSLCIFFYVQQILVEVLEILEPFMAFVSRSRQLAQLPNDGTRLRVGGDRGEKQPGTDSGR